MMTSIGYCSAQPLQRLDHATVSYNRTRELYDQEITTPFQLSQFSTSEIVEPELKGRLAHQEFLCPCLYGAFILGVENPPFSASFGT
jgi:hypothetical protein